MKSEFPYRILVGPVFPDYAWLGNYVNSPQIKTFSYVQNPLHPVDILYTEGNTNFSDIIACLPDGFIPDVVIWWDPVYHAMPVGIECCPFPTAVVVWDWNLGYSRIHDYLLAFDYILADCRLAQVLELRGLKNYGIWSSFAFDPTQFYRIPNTERDIDILFVGNLHHFVHPQRSYYLERIARLSDRFRIHIADGVQTTDYCKLLNRSKITFNYGICQVANMRTYEVPACGSLLLMEEENLEIRTILTDRQSCVLYNTHNLEALLEYYLSHPTERENIATQGYKTIQTFTLEKQFERLLALVPDIQRHFHRGAPRPFAHLSTVQQRRAVVRQQYFSQSPVKALFANNLSAQTEPSLVNAMVLFWLLPLRFDGVFSQFEPLLVHAVAQLTQAYQSERSPLVSIHLAWLSALQNNQEGALYWYQQSLQRVTELTITDLHLLTDYWLSLALISFDKSRLITEWERISYEHVDNPCQLLTGYCKLLKWFTWQAIGSLLSGHSAKEAYFKAIDAHDCFGEPYFALGQLYQQEQNWDMAIHYYLQAITCNPLFVAIWEQTARIPVAKCMALSDLSQLIDKCLCLSGVHPRFTAITKCLKHQQFLIDIKHYIDDISYLKSSLTNIPDDLSDFGYIQLFEIIQQRPQDHHIQNQLTQIAWSSLLPETLPSISPGTGFVFSKSRISAHQIQIERCYDRVSDLSQHIIGPDVYPYQFPTIAYSETISFEGWQSYNILLLCEQWSDTSTIHFIHCCTKAIQKNKNTGLLLWNPLKPPSENDLNILNEQLAESEQKMLVLLTEPLSLEQQASLIKNSNAVIGAPVGCMAYYLWWGVWLQTPVCFWTPDGIPDFLNYVYSFITKKELKELCFSDIDEFLFHHLDATNPENFINSEIHSKFHQFYQTYSLRPLLKSLWQIRL